MDYYTEGDVRRMKIINFIMGIFFLGCYSFFLFMILILPWSMFYKIILSPFVIMMIYIVVKSFLEFNQFPTIIKSILTIITFPIVIVIDEIKSLINFKGINSLADEMKKLRKQIKEER